MDIRKLIKIAGHTLNSGLLGAAASAGTGAASGAIGAAVMSKAGYENYSITDATRMAALGCGILGVASGIITYALVAHGAFRESSRIKSESRYFEIQNIIACLSEYTAHQIIGGLIGYSIYIKLVASTMPLENFVINMAVGAAITSIPVTIGLMILIGAISNYCATREPPTRGYAVVGTAAEDGDADNDPTRIERRPIHKATILRQPPSPLEIGAGGGLGVMGTEPPIEQEAGSDKDDTIDRRGQASSSPPLSTTIDIARATGMPITHPVKEAPRGNSSIDPAETARLLADKAKSRADYKRRVPVSSSRPVPVSSEKSSMSCR